MHLRHSDDNSDNNVHNLYKMTDHYAFYPTFIPDIGPYSYLLDCTHCTKDRWVMVLLTFPDCKSILLEMMIGTRTVAVDSPLFQCCRVIQAKLLNQLSCRSPPITLINPNTRCVLFTGHSPINCPRTWITLHCVLERSYTFTKPWTLSACVWLNWDWWYIRFTITKDICQCMERGASSQSMNVSYMICQDRFATEFGDVKHWARANYRWLVLVRKL